MSRNYQLEKGDISPPSGYKSDVIGKTGHRNAHNKKTAVGKICHQFAFFCLDTDTENSKFEFTLYKWGHDGRILLDRLKQYIRNYTYLSQLYKKYIFRYVSGKKEKKIS